MALDEIYKEVILDHYKNPRNKRELPGAAATCTRNNPLCGDEIGVSANVEDGRIAEIAFQGAGCSISQSSASMMTEAVTGVPSTTPSRSPRTSAAMMAGEAGAHRGPFGDLVALKGVVQYPIRIKCAVLAWDVLQEALEAGVGRGRGGRDGLALIASVLAAAPPAP